MLIQTISIHALCEEGDNNINKSTRPLEISIHALCEEGDPTWWRMRWNRWNFYPRPLRGGRQCPHPRCQAAADDFYPRPLRGGRLAMQMQQQECCCEFLSTPSARRATSCAGHQIAETRISIHALREEGDAMCVAFSSAKAYFYPRPPRGGRHLLLQHQHPERQISIHALREEGDCSDTVHHRCCRYFYPRPPRGGRPSVLKTGPRPILYFYPRPPRGGRLTWEIVAAACISISIHALREEGDPRRLRRCLLPCHFYPRPPRGGRPPSGA